TGSNISNLFFFSSRRRHTISDRDWSSDVCSSDLIELLGRAGAGELAQAAQRNLDVAGAELDLVVEVLELALVPDLHRAKIAVAEIGRASCRERVEISVGI